MAIEIRKCEECGGEFEFDTKYQTYQQNHPDRRGQHLGKYCSRKCMGLGQRMGQFFNCASCTKEIYRIAKEILKNESGRFFCDRSCAAKFNNKNKTHGCRRSKLEIFLEEKICEFFPFLQIHSNRIDTIGYELDFYFPTLKVAIEINGIFHYKPIYGEEKLQKIQKIDSNKIKLCVERDIDLFIYRDRSNKFTHASGMNTWVEIEALLLSRIKLQLLSACL